MSNDVACLIKCAFAVLVLILVICFIKNGKNKIDVFFVPYNDPRNSSQEIRQIVFKKKTGLK